MNEASITEMRNELREVTTSYRNAPDSRKHVFALTLRSRVSSILRQSTRRTEVFWQILICAERIGNDDTFALTVSRAVEGPGCCPSPQPVIREDIDAVLCYGCGCDM